jgi:hypothetical protein
MVVLTGFAAAIVPWTVHLAYSLPARHVTPHWDLAWIGFDVFEATAALATLAALFRQSRLLPMLAACAGTLLLCDAWFDIVTARPGRELTWAITSAVVAEVPLAALCVWLAHDARRFLAADARPTDE